MHPTELEFHSDENMHLCSDEESHMNLGMASRWANKDDLYFLNYCTIKK